MKKSKGIPVSWGGKTFHLIYPDSAGNFWYLISGLKILEDFKNHKRYWLFNHKVFTAEQDYIFYRLIFDGNEDK